MLLDCTQKTIIGTTCSETERSLSFNRKKASLLRCCCASSAALSFERPKLACRWPRAGTSMHRRRASMSAKTLLLAFAAVLFVGNSQSYVTDAALRVHLRPQMFSKCVAAGASAEIVTVQLAKCPCTFFVENEDRTKTGTRVEYLVLREKQSSSNLNITTVQSFSKKDNSTSNSLLTRFYLSPGASRTGHIEETGTFRLAIRAQAARPECLTVNYLFQRRGTQCPVRLPQPKARISGLASPPEPKERSLTKGIEKVINKIILGSRVHDPNLQRLMVSLRGPGGGACTGTVLSDRWILTAAHCAPTLDTELWVGGGAFGDGPAYRIERVVLHPKFAPGKVLGNGVTSAVANDIALIRTKGVIRGARPVAINGSPGFPLANDIVRAVGYGLSTKSTGATSETAAGLHQVDTTIVSFLDCRQAYASAGQGHELPGLRQKEHLCAGPDAVCGGGVCRGDSGGPLLVRAGEWFAQVAITSFGLDCRFKEFAPDVFARVSTYAQWISKVTEGAATVVDAGTGALNVPEVAPVDTHRSRERNTSISVVKGAIAAIFVAAVIGVIYWRLRKARQGKNSEDEQKV